MSDYLETEYNNRAKVRNSSGIIAGWARDAAAFRDGHTIAELDLPYGPTARQVVDIFWPDGSFDAPIALFIHGGYWQALGKDWSSHLASGLLSHGVAVAMMSYDLCPSVTLDVLTEQVRSAAVFLAARHGRPVLPMGHSAGGHLTAMLMATDWRARGLPHDVVLSAGLAISGVFDLTPLIHTSINSGLKLDEASARRLSPLFLPAPGGHLHAMVGGLEGVEFTRQSQEMAEAWDGTWEVTQGADHLTILDQFRDPDSNMVVAALRMIIMPNDIDAP